MADQLTDDRTAIRDAVRERYTAAARAITDTRDRGCCASVADTDCRATSVLGDEGEPFGAALYAASEHDELPDTATLASLGCGNPTAVAELHDGETVLDLGSGGGIDVLLSARRVGPSGKAYGLDMTDEMLALARENQRKAGVNNVEWLPGRIEDIPLPAESVDVVISNCVINLSADKPKVLREAARVLRPGALCGLDVIADPTWTPSRGRTCSSSPAASPARSPAPSSSRRSPRPDWSTSRSPRHTACTSTPARGSSAPASPARAAATAAPRRAAASRPPRANAAALRRPPAAAAARAGDRPAQPFAAGAGRSARRVHARLRRLRGDRRRRPLPRGAGHGRRRPRVRAGDHGHGLRHRPPLRRAHQPRRHDRLHAHPALSGPRRARVRRRPSSRAPPPAPWSCWPSGPARPPSSARRCRASASAARSSTRSSSLRR